MEINYGKGTTEFGPGVDISLIGDEVALAILAYLVSKDVHINGPQTITVNNKLCQSGNVHVDPSGFVINDAGIKMSGRGPESGDETFPPHWAEYGKPLAEALEELRQVLEKLLRKSRN